MARYIKKTTVTTYELALTGDDLLKKPLQTLINEQGLNLIDIKFLGFQCPVGCAGERVSIDADCPLILVLERRVMS